MTISSAFGRIGAVAGPAARRMRGLLARRWRFIGPGAVVALVALMAVSSALGFVINLSHQAQLVQYEDQTRLVRAFQTALIDAETGVRGYALTARVEYLEPFYSGMKTVKGDEAAPLMADLDRRAAPSAGNSRRSDTVSATLADLYTAWETVIRLTSEGKRREAEAAEESMQSKILMDRMRGHIARYLQARLADAARIREDVYAAHVEHLLISIGGALFAIGGLTWAFLSGRRETHARELAVSEAVRAKHQVEQLFSMADMLQSAVDAQDMNVVLSTTAMELLPDFSGAMYVFNNSRDRLDLAAQWGEPVVPVRAPYFAPESCWALKRGKTNINLGGRRALRCEHASLDRATLEVPMAARGQLYGLLEFSAAGEEAGGRLAEIRRLAAALGDAMSLALASAALRERLRNQAIRDALTGLYNRRFLEETLARMVLEAERRGAPLTAIMIDLDHFKRLNDAHGHAMGDAVLRETAAAIVGCLRATDVACRYGGEELFVLLHDCPLAKGMQKAEQIRTRIAEIAVGNGVSVTASLGVASVPEAVPYAGDLLSSADAALYRAKQAGRNQVVAASHQPGGEYRGQDGLAMAAVQAAE